MLVAYNSHSNSGSKMEIADVAAALDDFPRLDFILFDACFMQAVEVAYELRHVAKYIASSPAEIPNPANIILGGYDNDEKSQEILVKKDTDTTEKFYVANPDLIYIYLDGCKFYFQRD